jgi:UDP-N-acetylglucosamine 2-epimerase (non-hydrolysing)
MKIAPIVRALQAKRGLLSYRLVHTGQHYDREMNDVFFAELGIPRPDVWLGAGGGSHATQTSKTMIGFEEFCASQRPDIVVVVGDVNSTLACSIVAKKSLIRVAHVEAGLRINRIVTDSITDLFFITEPSGVDNLRREGKAERSLHYVGHVMVDNLLYQRRLLDNMNRDDFISAQVKQKHACYGVITLHRPSNVDDPEVFRRLAEAFHSISMRLPLVFPVHPRTKGNIEKFTIDLGPRVILTPPLPYMDFLNLWKDAAVVLTDSGGLQEETTALGIPCLTVRDNTERPVTVEEGTNVLVGTTPNRICDAAFSVLAGHRKQGHCPHLWDGKAAERIVNVLSHELLENA